MFYGWYIVGACCLISFYVTGTVFFGFTAAFEPIANEFGWSYTKISLAASLRGFEMGLFVPVAGMLIDRYGPRRLVFAGSIINGLGLILLSKINSLATFYASFILITIGQSATASMLLMAVVGNWFYKNSGLAMGITTSGVSLGGLLIPLITLIIDSFGWRQAMIILGLGMWTIPLSLSLLLRHKPEQYGYMPDGEKNGFALDNDLSNIEKKEKGSKGAKEALTNLTFWIIALAYLCQVLPVTAVMTHIMPYLSTIGIERSSSSLIASAIPFLTVFGRVGCGWLGDRADKVKVATLAFTLSSLGLFLLGYTAGGQNWVLVAFAIIYGLGWGGGVPMLTVLSKAFFGTKNLATIVGFVSGVMLAGSVAGPPLVGWIFDKLGNYQPGWFLLTGISGLATILFYACLRNRPYLEKG
jgi:sugar phosphate permease